MHVSAKHCSGKGLAGRLFTRIELDLRLEHIVAGRSINLSSGCVKVERFFSLLFLFISAVQNSKFSDCLHIHLGENVI